MQSELKKLLKVNATLTVDLAILLISFALVALLN